jgi:hypothetical protein
MTATNNLDLETKAEEFLGIQGVHQGCFVRRLLNTLIYERTLAAEYKAQGESRNYRLAVKHLNQMENLLLKEIKESLDHLEFFRTHASEILGSEVFTHLDWGGGWEWKVQVIRVDGTLVKVGDGGGFAIYQGQNTKPLVTKDFLLSSSLG